MSTQPDPTRIPRILDELRQTWEGQPDLPLATLFGVLANQGVGWGTPDDELVAALQKQRESHPGELVRNGEGRAASPVAIETTEPPHVVTLSGTTAVVRSLSDRERQPSVWEYASVRPTGPGRPLVVTDGEGIDHRLGVVTLLSAVDEGASPTGLTRGAVGNFVWLVILSGGERLLITHRIHRWVVDGRVVTKTAHAWQKVVRCEVGESFAFAPSGGGAEIVLAEVERVILLET